jgi:tRNA(Arg) A34 adenosine deaminase TadA
VTRTRDLPLYDRTPIERMDVSSLGSKAKRGVRMAVAAARSSRHRRRVGAAAISGGRFLGKACNTPRSDIEIVGHEHCSRHAECALVRRLRDANGADVFVARLDRRGRLSNARPCVMCVAELRQAGFSRVWFTIEEGCVGVLDL